MSVAFLALLCAYTMYSVVTNRAGEERRPRPEGGVALPLFDLASLWNFAVDSPLVLSAFFSVAVAEELIWRVAAQPLLIDLTGSAVAGVLVAAVGFSVVHKHFFRNELRVSVEFIGFALLLGVLYYWTGSLILVVVIHAVRDIEIAYVEYVIKVGELGDEKQAAREVEKAYGPQRQRVPVMVFVTQTPLFALACYFGVWQEVFSRQLVSPLHIGLGFLAGHLIFGVSLLVTHRSL